MAMTADSSSAGLDLPPKNMRWNQVVLGESESISVVDRSTSSSLSSSPPSSCSLTDSASITAEKSDDGDNALDQSKKPAGEKPSNDAVEVAHLTGAVSVPVLSESSRASSTMAVADGSASSLRGPIIQNAPRNQVSTSASSSSALNHMMQARSRHGGGGRPVQRGFTQPPPPPPPSFPYPAFPFHLPPGNNFVGFAPPMQPVGPYVRQPYGRGHASRRGGYRGYARDRGLPRGFSRPPNTQLLPPPPPLLPYRVYGNNPAPFHGYVQQVPVESYGGVPFIAPGPPVSAQIVQQIDFYFSNANLAKDAFLKSCMDNEGWVPVSVIASFRRIKQLTDNIQLILDSMRSSAVVEVQGEKLRRRHDWMRWLIPRRHSAVESSADTLETSFEQMTMVEDTASRNSSESESSNAEGTEDTSRRN